MKTRVDAVLRVEAARYALRFHCESCAHFVEEAGECERHAHAAVQAAPPR